MANDKYFLNKQIIFFAWYKIKQEQNRFALRKTQLWLIDLK
jgi:hypothetical protein